jgi:hypothetical protein
MLAIHLTSLHPRFLLLSYVQQCSTQEHAINARCQGIVFSLVIVRIGLGLTGPEGKTKTFISLRVEPGVRVSMSHKPEGVELGTSVDGHHTAVHFAEPPDTEGSLQTIETSDFFHGGTSESMSYQRAPVCSLLRPLSS